MHNSKLLDVLRHLNKSQVRYCDQFLPMLLSDKNNETHALYQHLRACAPNYKSKLLARQTVQKTLNCTEKQLAYCSTELLQAINHCLLQEHLARNPLEQALQLMSIYQEMGLKKNYQSAARMAQKLLTTHPYRDPIFLEHQHRFLRLELQTKPPYQRIHHPELQAAANALDEAYLCAKLHYLLEMTSAGNVLEIPYDSHLAEAVKFWSEQPPFKDSLIISIYRAILAMVEESENEENFVGIRILLEEKEAEIPPDLLKRFYTYLLNYCTQRITLHHATNYYEHYLTLNSYLINQGLLLEDGYLAPARYNNLILVALRTGRLSWAKQFLNNYRKYLPEADRENTHTYNQAYCLYYEQQYDKASVLLAQLNLRDPLLSIAVRNLIVKILWETDNTTELLDFLDTYRVYVSRQKLTKARLKKRVNRFITFTRYMAKVPDFAPENRQELLQKLPAATEVLEHDWLKEQLST